MARLGYAVILSFIVYLAACSSVNSPEQSRLQKEEYNAFVFNKFTAPVNSSIRAVLWYRSQAKVWPSEAQFNDIGNKDLGLTLQLINLDENALKYEIIIDDFVETISVQIDRKTVFGKDKFYLVISMDLMNFSFHGDEVSIFSENTAQLVTNFFGLAPAIENDFYRTDRSTDWESNLKAITFKALICVMLGVTNCSQTSQ